MPDTNKPGPSQLPNGGQGEGAARVSRSDMAMYKKAAEERWPVPPQIRNAIAVSLGEVFRKPKEGQEAPSTRDKIAAAKVFVAMDKTNLEWLRFQHETQVTDADDFLLELDLAPEDPPAHEPDGPAEAVPGE